MKTSSIKNRLTILMFSLTIASIFVATSLGYYYGKKYIFLEIINHMNTLLKLEEFKTNSFINERQRNLNEFVKYELLPIMNKDNDIINIKSVINSLISSKENELCNECRIIIFDNHKLMFSSGKDIPQSIKENTILWKDTPFLVISQKFNYKYQPLTIKEIIPFSILIKQLGIDALSNIGYSVEIMDTKGNAIFSSSIYNKTINASCKKKYHDLKWNETDKIISKCLYYKDLNILFVISKSKKTAYIGIKKLQVASILFIIFMSIITFFFSVIFSNSIARPLKFFAVKVKEIGMGNLNERVPILRDDEIGEFSNEFNKMADKLQELYNNLEQKVKIRTEELSLALEETQKISKRLESIMNNISAGVLTFDENGKILEINHAAQVLPLKINQNFWDFIKSNCGTAKENIKNEGKISCNFEKNEIIIDYKINIITTSSGDILHIFTFDDITDKIEFEQKLIHSEKLATVGILAAGLAHEVGTPLNVIMGRAEFMLEKAEDNEIFAKSLKSIISQIERISAIIRQLLDFARPQEPSLKETNILQIIRDTVELVKVQTDKKKILLELSCQKKMPKLFIDKHQWQQVFLNLFINSIDAIGSNGKILICTKISGDLLIIKVSDTGIGIDKENINRIFDPFFTTKKQGKGTGLGLSVTNMIIKQHNGWIKVTSKKNMGTTFNIYLPIGSSK